MKKVLLSVLCAVMLLFLAGPALQAEATQVQTQAEQTDETDLVGDVDPEVMPEREVNPGTMVIGDNCFTIGDYTYIPVGSFDPDGIYLYVFDEDGELYGKGSLMNTLYDRRVIGYVRVDAIAESKDLTFALYSFKEDPEGSYNYVYALKSVEKFTITPTRWQGNPEIGRISAYKRENNMQLRIYLPPNTQTEGLKISLMDGERRIGMYEVERSGGSYFDYMDTHVAKLPEAFHTGSYTISFWHSELIPFVAGTLRWGEPLQPGKNYTLMAQIAGIDMNLGEIYCDPEPRVLFVGDGHPCSSDKPLIGLDLEVQDFSKVKVQVLDPETFEVIGTTEGGNILFGWTHNVVYEIITDKAKEEFTGELVLDIYYDNKKIMRTWYEYPSESYSYINDCYYDHVNHEVVMVGYIPEGITMNLYPNIGFDVSHTTDGYITRVKYLHYGQQMALSEGLHMIDCVFTMEDEVVCSQNVMFRVWDFKNPEQGADESYPYTWKLDNPYRFADGGVNDISCYINYNWGWSETDSYNITYKKVGSKEEVSVQATPTHVEYPETGEDYWCFTGQLPALESGAYEIHVYRNSAQVGNSALYLYVLDRNLHYAKLDSVETIGNKADMVISFPVMQETIDPAKLTLSAFNLNNENVAVSSVVTGDGTKLYVTVEMPKDLYIVDISMEYDGHILYNVNPYSEFLNDMCRVDASGKLKVSTLCGDKVYNHEYSFRHMGDNIAEAFSVSKPCTVHVAETGTMNILKTWEFTEDNVFYNLTPEMVEGLSCADGRVCYDIYFSCEDGDVFLGNWYLNTIDRSIVVENGIGMDAGGRYCLYIDSKIATGYTGLYFWSEENSWVMISAGYVDFAYTGLVLHDNVWWYVQDGALNSAFTGLVTYGGKLWYVTGGHVDFTYQGLLCYNDDWYYIVDGAVDQNYNGLAFVNNDWWYVVSGKIDFGFTGLAQVNNEYWYVVQGKIDFSCTGLVCINDEWFSIEQGRWNRACNGMLFVNNAWWYVVNGKVDFGFTGLTFVAERWWYVNAGRIDFTYCGLCDFNGKVWYIVNGEINYKTYGLVCVNDRWFFVDNGSVRTDYTGMLFVNGDWWYVAGGEIDFSFSGLFFYNDTWWYVENGRIDFAKTGPIFFGDEWWYVEKGYVNLSYTGFAFVNEVWWWVINGKIDFTYCGIQMFNEKYWYIRNAEIDFNYNGTVTGPDGNIYEVVNGEVIGYTV